MKRANKTSLDQYQVTLPSFPSGLNPMNLTQLTDFGPMLIHPVQSQKDSFMTGISRRESLNTQSPFNRNDLRSG